VPEIKTYFGNILRPFRRVKVQIQDDDLIHHESLYLDAFCGGQWLAKQGTDHSETLNSKIEFQKQILDAMFN
jgi:hypothetical protein